MNRKYSGVNSVEPEKKAALAAMNRKKSSVSSVEPEKERR